MIGFFKSLDFVSLILGAVLGATAGTWFNYFVIQPKLKVVGSGGGSGHGFRRNNLRIGNEPGLLGLSLKGTTLFGRRIHGSVEKGLIIERANTQECNAFLYDKETGEFIKQLFWRSRENPNKIVRSVSLSSGESAELIIFAGIDSDSGKYFVYEPVGVEEDTPKIPPEAEKFDVTKEFTVKISYLYGKRELILGFKMVKGFGGKLSYQHQGGSGSF